MQASWAWWYTQCGSQICVDTFRNLMTASDRRIATGVDLKVETVKVGQAELRIRLYQEICRKECPIPLHQCVHPSPPMRLQKELWTGNRLFSCYLKNLVSLESSLHYISITDFTYLYTYPIKLMGYAAPGDCLANICPFLRDKENKTKKHYCNYCYEQQHWIKWSYLAIV